MEYNFETTATAGNLTTKMIFDEINKTSKYKYEVYIASDKYSRYDSIVMVNDKKLIVEHKTRDFNSYQLKIWYNNELMLEKSKYEALKECAEYAKCDGIYYICTLKDGSNYIFDLSKLNVSSSNLYCPKQSCGNKKFIPKEVYKLDIKNALKIVL